MNKAIGASEFFNKSDFHDGPVHAYLLLRWQNSEKVLELDGRVGDAPVDRVQEDQGAGQLRPTRIGGN